MSNQKQLNESNFVIDFVEAVFDAIVRQRNKAIQKAAEQDPEFKRIVAQIQKGRDDLAVWAKEQAKEDSAIAQYYRSNKGLGA